MFGFYIIAGVMSGETINNAGDSEEEAARFSKGGRKFAEASVAEALVGSDTPGEVRKIVSMDAEGNPIYAPIDNAELIRIFNETVPAKYRGPQGQRHR